MILFFSQLEMDGQCTRVSYHDALRTFIKLFDREPKMAWMSEQCMHDVMKWSRPVELEGPDLGVHQLEHEGFKIMVSVNLKDPGMYFGVGD